MNSHRSKFPKLALVLCLSAGISAGQTPKAAPITPMPPRHERPVSGPATPGRFRVAVAPGDGVTSERSIAVDRNANLKMCVVEGDLKINGWHRAEIRVFVKNGSRIGIRVLEKDPSSGMPVWILLSNAADEKPGKPPQSECLSGERIEIDVPITASISVAGRATETVIDSVKKVTVKNVEGNISLRNIPGGITALTYQGDVTVENSGGAISLESATGNIVGYDVRPGEIGDVLKVKTSSGAISLQKLEHRQIEANSITGSVLFNGRFLPGGLYTFKTSNGAVRLVIPADSACTFIASYGFGQFNSEIPLKYLTENDSSTGKSLTATIGSGDARVNITTTSGSIGIKKQ